MRIILLLLSLMLFVALASNFSHDLNWPSNLSELSAGSIASSTNVAEMPARAPEEAVETEAEPVLTLSPHVEESQPEPVPAPEPVPSGYAAAIELEVLRLSNIEREKVGLNSLSPSSALTDIADGHSADMHNRNFFSHDNPDGCSSSCRATNAGYRWRAIGENIFMLKGWDLSAEEAAIMIVNGWLASPPHKENMLKTGYTETGVGVFVKGEAVYATALYARPR